MLDPGFIVRLTISFVRLSRRRIQVIGSSAWPMREGTIHDNHLLFDDLQGWVAELTYSYAAEGEYYSGKWRLGCRRKKRAEALLERLPRGTHLAIRYKPENPAVSTILYDDLGLLTAGL